MRHGGDGSHEFTPLFLDATNQQNVTWTDFNRVNERRKALWDVGLRLPVFGRRCGAVDGWPHPVPEPLGDKVPTRLPRVNVHARHLAPPPAGFFDLSDEGHRRCIKCRSELLNDRQRGISTATFEEANIGTVKTRSVGKLLLRNTKRRAALPNNRSEAFGGHGLAHT